MLFMSWKLVIGHNTRITKDSIISLDCFQFDRQIFFFIHGHIENISRNIEATEIVIQINEIHRKHGGVKTDRFARFIRNTFDIEFALYFDLYSDLVRSNYSNYHSWPKIWNFARVVRNAIAHGGTINIESPSAPKVEWQGVQYDHTKFGRRVEEDLAIGDLIFLMMNMDQELDEIGAPSTPYTA